ncbi:MAG: sugar kinase [Cyanobacteria bacterium SIG30]|nr:sugar kinase [Cyanobacteria bacterium SIG30]
MFTEKDIVTIGEGLIELSSPSSLITTETFNKSYGGDTLVSVVAGARLGLKTGYITKVGNDHFGEYLMDAWSVENIDISQVKLSNGLNGFYFLTKENDGNKATYYRKKTAASELSIDDINFDYIKNTKMFYATGFVQSLSLSCAEVVREIYSFAKQNNILTAYNVNFSGNVWSAQEAKEAFEEIAQNIDILIIDAKKDAPAIFGFDSVDKIIKQTSDMTIKTVIIKDDDSVYLDNEGQVIQEKRIQFEHSSAGNLTGINAGFNGVFLNYYLNKSPYEALKYAICAEFLQKQKIGAVRSIPTKQEIEELYNRIYE